MHDDRFFELARGWRPGRYNPNTDVFFDPAAQHLVVQIELAGADPDSLTVSADEATLYVTGSRVDRSSPVSRGLSLLQKEIEYGEFAKRVPLPGPIDVDAANATYKDGILTITLPLAQPQGQAVGTELRMTVRKISL